MEQYLVPSEYQRWLAKTPPWLAWVLILTIGGGFAEVITPFMTFGVFRDLRIGIAVIILFTLLYCVVLTAIQLIGFSLMRYKAGSTWRLLLAWMPIGLLTLYIGYRNNSFNPITVYINDTIVGFFIGIWAGLWLLKILPKPMSINDKSLWISVYALSFAAGFLFISLAVASGPMREPKDDSISYSIYYALQLAKWLIMALPTGVLFQWMLRRQLADRPNPAGTV